MKSILYLFAATPLIFACNSGTQHPGKTNDSLVVIQWLNLCCRCLILQLQKINSAR